MLFEPVNTVNVDSYAYAPVAAGLWKQKELWDGTYNIDDLLDLHEVLYVKAENERRYQEFLQAEK